MRILTINNQFQSSPSKPSISHVYTIQYTVHRTPQLLIYDLCILCFLCLSQEEGSVVRRCWFISLKSESELKEKENRESEDIMDSPNLPSQAAENEHKNKEQIFWGD